MDLLGAVKILQKQGIACDLSSEILAEISNDVFEEPPTDILVQHTELLDVLIVHYSSDQSLKHGWACKDGFIHHDWRFGQETDDIIKEFSDIVGGKPPILRQLQVKPDSISLERFDGKKGELQISNSVADVADVFNETLAERGDEKRFYPLETEGDSFAYLYLDREKFERILDSGLLPISDVDEGPTPESFAELKNAISGLAAAIPGFGELFGSKTGKGGKAGKGSAGDVTDSVRRGGGSGGGASTSDADKVYDALTGIHRRSLPQQDVKTLMFLEMEISNLRNEVSDTSLFGDQKPRLLEMLLKRARILLDAGKYDNAIEQYTEVAEMAGAHEDPVYRMPEYDSHVERGEAYFAKGDAPAAVADFSRAIELCPQYSSVYRKRSEAYEKMGKPELAEADRQTAEEVAESKFKEIAGNLKRTGGDGGKVDWY